MLSCLSVLHQQLGFDLGDLCGGFRDLRVREALLVAGSAFRMLSSKCKEDVLNASANISRLHIVILAKAWLLVLTPTPKA